jgi:hypothetical protein
MKRFLVALVASVALLVAAPVASAAPGPPTWGPPTMKTVSCTLVAGPTTQHFSFQLPSVAVQWFQLALAKVQLHYPGLSCTIS